MAESTLNRSINSKRLVIGRKIFIGLLALNGLMQLAIGLMMLVNFPMVAETLMNINYTDEMGILGMTIGVNVLFGAAIVAVSVYWTLRKNPAGVITGALFGVLAIAAGLLTFSLFGRIDGLMMDVVRGVLIVITAAFAWHELTDQA